MFNIGILFSVFGRIYLQVGSKCRIIPGTMAGQNRVTYEGTYLHLHMYKNVS